VPKPGSLVVKKGSNMRSAVAASMPCPVSVTEAEILARRERWPVRQPGFVFRLHRVQGDVQVAPFVHGLRRVGAQVEHHQLEPAGVAEHHRLVGGSFDPQADDDGRKKGGAEEVDGLLADGP
jgi:hypothetical protein